VDWQTAWLFDVVNQYADGTGRLSQSRELLDASG